MSRSVEFLHDPYNQKIRVGSRVAYNYQGQVRIGLVTSLERWNHNDRWSGNRTRWRIQIQEQKEGFVSKVTHPRNLVVIPDENS